MTPDNAGRNPFLTAFGRTDIVAVARAAPMPLYGVTPPNDLSLIAATLSLSRSQDEDSLDTVTLTFRHTTSGRRIEITSVNQDGGTPAPYINWTASPPGSLYYNEAGKPFGRYKDAEALRAAGEDGQALVDRLLIGDAVFRATFVSWSLPEPEKQVSLQSANGDTVVRITASGYSLATLLDAIESLVVVNQRNDLLAFYQHALDARLPLEPEELT